MTYSRDATPVVINVSEGGVIIGQEQDSLGGSFDINQSFDGTIYEMLLFNRALTSAEINTYMNSDNVTDAGLVAYYRFENNGNNVLIDYSGHNYNGTIYGGTWIENSGVKRMKMDSGSWVYDDTYTFTGLSSGSHTITAEDNVGNIKTKTVSIP